MTELEAPKLIAETAEWLVFMKPAGWLSVPASPSARALGVSELLSWAREKCGEAWPVHRLDLETSGVLLLARTREAHRKANGWFASHKVKKSYTLLGSGLPTLPTFKVKAAVGGSSASTVFEVQEKFSQAGAFLARALPLTGRRHQIRIHLAGQGYPILGDEKYRGPVAAGGVKISRVALHAQRLELPSGEVFEAEWPEDLRAWVSKLRGHS
jgi:23S rRNA-/tRNA-specific pseudouridylate synthase